MNKRDLMMALLVVALTVVLISGLVPYQVTRYGSSCDFDFSVNHTVCKPTSHTFQMNGWLARKLTGCQLVNCGK